ncbi:MAG: FdhF/YdeP family oxidoreductase [Bacteroidota bacterium]
MEENRRSEISVEPPIETEGLIVRDAKDFAAGLPSILSSLKHAFAEMDTRRCAKTLFSVNQLKGFDCPGCAWPDPSDHRSKLGEYCENGVKAIAEEATVKRIDPTFFQQYSVKQLSEQSDMWLGKQGRLTEPMILRKGTDHYEPISWQDAFKHIGNKLNNLGSPDEAIFYTSGRTSNEAAFLYQLFVRHFGTNNMPDCSNMCHESSGVALSETLGIGKGSVRLEDIYIADLLIILGQNPGTNHPRMLSALEKAKANGAKIITINPLPEAGLMGFKNPQSVSGLLGVKKTLTDLFLQVRVGGDVPLVKALMKVMADKETAYPGTVFDKAFIEEKTHGFEAFIEDLRKADIPQLAKECGVSEQEIRAAAELIMTSEKIITCWAMGLTQHPNGVQNIREVVNLLLLKGSVGKPGAGTCPVRGHSNVQGDRTVGIYDKPKPAFLDKISENFNFDPPRHHGFDVVEAIKAMADGRGKVFFAMGGNFLSASPDTAFTAKALQNCGLTVQVSTKLNRSHLVTGEAAIILPCIGRTELDEQASGTQFVSVENSMGIVHASRGKLKPASAKLLSEPAIVAGLAKATLKEKSKVDWDHLVSDYDHIRTAIEKTIPGFERYNERVRNDGGFYLPNCARDGDFKTATGKANFTINPIPENPLNADEFIIMTIRSHDQFNTTIYGLNDRYRGVYNGRRVVFMNEADMKASGFKQGDHVDLVNNFDGIKRVAPKFVVIPFSIPSRCLATYFPEANVLVPINKTAKGSNTPASKLVIVKLNPSA